jgi:glycosyltransferase involved in cell wall biosynthesis
VYFRIEESPPTGIYVSVAPYRQLIGSPFVVWEFNTVPEFGYVLGRTQKEIRRAIQGFKRYRGGCDLAVCVSRSLAEYVTEQLGIKHPLIAPNGSDPDLFQPHASPVKRVQRTYEKLNVIWIGSSYLRWHNFDLLREAAMLLWERDEGAGIMFHILGEASIGLMRDMPLNVHYYGPEHYKNLPHWLAAMDVGLCLYRQGPADYSSPIKLFDYMASGLTVVSTIQPQVQEVFEQLGQTDLLVPPNDPEALAEVLLSVSLDRDRINRQGNAGRQLVIEFYNWRRSVQDVIAVIKNALDGHG